MEEQDQEPDSGYKSPPKYDKDEVVRKMEEDDDDKIEEMIDDISTNEMFGSSILSMENQRRVLTRTKNTLVWTEYEYMQYIDIDIDMYPITEPCAVVLCLKESKYTILRLLTGY